MGGGGGDGRSYTYLKHIPQTRDNWIGPNQMTKLLRAPLKKFKKKSKKLPIAKRVSNYTKIKAA